MALHAAGADFEDERIDMNELIKRRGGMDSVSDDVPLGTLPTLTFPDGKVICQSTAILRYVSSFSNLYPHDPYDCLVIDEVIDTLHDFTYSIPLATHPDIDKLSKKWLEVRAPQFIAHVERRIKESGGPFILGKNLSIADLVVWNSYETFAGGYFSLFKSLFNSLLDVICWITHLTFISSLA